MHYEILEFIDLGDTKLFEASVLPCVIIARKKQVAESRKASRTRFLKIYEDLGRPETPAASGASVCSVLEDAVAGEYRISGRRYTVESGNMQIPPDDSEPWSMTTTEQQRWIKQVEAHSAGRLSEFAQVRVGIKTTADEVFIRLESQLQGLVQSGFGVSDCP